jgi:hypothetical protein
MSDAFGPDTSTASGGLQSDMSGVGGGPSKPAQVPSALGGLAAFARQMFGGSPAPQPVRGPQIGPQGQLTPPPPMPRGPQQPRMTGDTANLAIPRGGPQPPSRFTPFMKSQPTRDFREWGDPEPFGNMPNSFEVSSIFQGTGQFFKQNGSQPSMLLAAALTGHASEYVDGLMKGQQFKANMAKEQMAMAALKLQEQQEAEHHVYSDILAEYSVENNTLDPTKMIKPINGVMLRDAMLSQADQLGDTQMANLLHDGKNFQQIMWFQQQRDASLRDLQKANAKTTEQDAQDALVGLREPTQQPGATGGATNWASAPGQPTTPPTAGAAPPGTPPSPGQPAPQAVPGQPQPDGTQVASADGTPGATPPAAPQDDQTPLKGWNPTVRTGAINVLKGIEPGNMFGPQTRTQMGIGSNKLQDAIEDIVKDPNVKPGEVADAIAKRVDPGIADDFRNWENYKRLAGSSGQAGTREQNYLDLLSRAATKDRPGDPSKNVEGWSQQIFKRVQDFSAENSAAQTTIRRANTMSEAGKLVVDDLHRIQQGPGYSETQFQQQLGYFLQHGSVNPDYAQLFRDWQNYNIETNVLSSGRAGGSVTEEQQAQQTVPDWFGNPEAYYRVVQHDAGIAKASLGSYHGMWDQMDVRTVQGGPEPMPGWNPEAESTINAFTRMDPKFGAVPSNDPTKPRADGLDLHVFPDGVTRRYTGADPRNPGAQSNWVTVND